MVADSHARGPARQLQARRLALRPALATSLALSILLWVVPVPLGFIPDHRIIFAIRLMPAAFTLRQFLRATQFFAGRANMTPTAYPRLANRFRSARIGSSLYLALMALLMSWSAIVGTPPEKRPASDSLLNASKRKAP